MTGSKQPEINLLLPAVSPALGENAEALMVLWKADMEWRARTLTGSGASAPVLDEFYAVRHDVSAAEIKRAPAVDDDPILPVRSEVKPVERFRGKHGNTVVIKRK